MTFCSNNKNHKTESTKKTLALFSAKKQNWRKVGTIYKKKNHTNKFNNFENMK